MHIKKFRNSFELGYNFIAKIGDKKNGFLNFGVYVFNKEKILQGANKTGEICFLLIKGSIEVKINNKKYTAKRENIFKENPATFLLSADNNFFIKAKENNTELAIIKTNNKVSYKNLIILPQQINTEHRGRKILNNTAYRLVKTFIDKNNAPQSNIIVGEVINFAGKWSSYPPHHHPQPEIYFYKFSQPQGYGFSQLGEKVIKVKNNDVVKILNNVDHPQVSAPGYAMWYLWIIKDTKEKQYLGFEYTKEHNWMIK